MTRLFRQSRAILGRILPQALLLVSIVTSASAFPEVYSYVSESECGSGYYSDYPNTGRFTLPSAEMVEYAVRVDVPAGPFQIERICVNIDLSNEDSFESDVVVYANDGGIPGVVLASLPVSITSNSEYFDFFGTNCSQRVTALGIQINSNIPEELRAFRVSGPFFAAIRTNATLHPTAALAYGENAARTTFIRENSELTWSAMPGFAAAIRVEGTSLECSSAHAFDDGSMEQSVATDGDYTAYAMQFSVPSERYSVHGACLWLEGISTGTFSGQIAFFDSQANLIVQRPISTSVAAGSSAWVHFDLRPVYLMEDVAVVAVTWDTEVEGAANVRLGIDTSESTEARPLFAIRSSDEASVPLTDLLPGARVLGIRLDTRSVGFGGPVESCEGNLLIDGELDGDLDGGWELESSEEMSPNNVSFDGALCISGDFDSCSCPTLRQGFWLPSEVNATLSFDFDMDGLPKSNGDDCEDPIGASLDVYLDDLRIYTVDDHNPEFQNGLRRVFVDLAAVSGYHEISFNLSTALINACIDNICLSTAGYRTTALCPEGVAPSDACRHSSDLDGDGMVSLSELLRAIQFYNSGGLHCAADANDTEDGFLPGADVEIGCAPHKVDYAPQDWVISLSELLRLVQFYNIGGYVYCPGAETEDGYCPEA